VTREEIEQKMDELAREYAETHDSEIREEIYRLSRELTTHNDLGNEPSGKNLNRQVFA